MFFYKHDVYLA